MRRAWTVVAVFVCAAALLVWMGLLVVGGYLDQMEAYRG